MLGPIELQFSFQNDLSSELIVYFSHGAGYSHVDTIMPAGVDWCPPGWLLGARSDVRANIPAGVFPRPPDYAPFSRMQRVAIPTLDPTFYYAFLYQQVGKPYDKRAIFGFAAGRNWRNPDGWFCSELVTNALEVQGFFPYLLSTPENKVDPDDLLLAISARVKIY